MSTRKRWRVRVVPGSSARSYPSQAAAYRAVRGLRNDVDLGMSSATEARVYCDDALYEVLPLITKEQQHG